jgi:hypothetical protein
MVAEKNSVWRVNGISFAIHAIGLVYNEDFYACQKELAAFEMVQQTARRCDEHVSASLQLLFLLVKRHAADQEGNV